MKNFAYVRATSVEEAIGQLSVEGQDARVLAGGLDQLALMKEGLVVPDLLVSLSGVEGLDQIAQLGDGRIRLGARATLRQIAEEPLVLEGLEALALAAGEAGPPQVRNAATLGGNLLQRPRCWYFRNRDISCLKKGGGSCPGSSGEAQYLAIFETGPCYAVHGSSLACALLALDATVNLSGPEGNRAVAVESFFTRASEDPEVENVLEPAEVLTSVDVSAQPTSSSSCYKKLKHKEAFDWAMAEVAVRLILSGNTVQDCRIAMGAVASTPIRTSAAEELLIGRTLSSSLISEAAELAVADATPFSSNGYKVPMTKTLVEETLLEAGGVG